jgi:hypothetical protein
VAERPPADPAYNPLPGALTVEIYNDQLRDKIAASVAESFMLIYCSTEKDKAARQKDNAWIAEAVYDFADAMLLERERRQSLSPDRSPEADAPKEPPF